MRTLQFKTQFWNPFLVADNHKHNDNQQALKKKKKKKKKKKQKPTKWNLQS